MKQVSRHIVWVWILALALPQAAQGTMIRISDPSVCIDGMQTNPGSDELEPIMAAADVCSESQPEAPVSI
jgi:hypothetical protein